MILGTILVGVVVAKSRHMHQLALARRQQAAVRTADELITSWWASESGVPIGRSGQIEGDETLTWETRLVANEPLAEIGVRVVRVEIHDADPAVRTTREDEPLVTVDLALDSSAPTARPSEDKPGDKEAGR